MATPRLKSIHRSVPGTVPAAPSPVDEILPAGKLFTLGLQHVLVMYAGAIAVPLIVGRALKLPPEQVAALISADLFCCGLVTLIQSLGIGKYFGIRLPVMMGVTFAAVSPMLAMANNPALGITGIFGAVIGAGVVSMLIAPFISRLLALFPPVVTGSIIAVIGVSLMRVGVNWTMGGPPAMAQIADPAFLKMAAAATAAGLPAPAGPAPLIANPGYGALDNMGIAFFVLAVILLVAKYGRGFLSNIAVLIGIIAGTALSFALGKADFAKVAGAKAFAIVTPFQFGMPTFDVVAIVTMSLVMIVVMIESLGMFLALGEMTDKRITQDDISRGLRVDGLGTLIGGIFNTFPYTSFSQNVGLVGVTGVRSRWVCVAAGLILLVMGVIQKIAQTAEAVPAFVLGGAGLVMFGMVAATGIRILAGVDYKSNRNNLFIVALAIGFGMLPLVAEQYAQHMPKALSPLLHSGILLAAIVAVLLNLFFNGLASQEKAREQAREHTHGSE
ncbi:nucleobase:cation symporter-2 family protein [Janthinobacterium sp. SUN120]|uniref:nucleobase:cation symporter-2 family protein n=1 Tax=Janthinobacterium sp. SUN120 TaxID=3004099 RepID=UPI0025B22C24|nr:nucleobase:cation symporter-2 family protein [Janthinobacterium sp. SUN120]MDN2713476.1 nucleobase:cation symporter-2 family protein [Janthinobacterium sp. SUN120]